MSITRNWISANKLPPEGLGVLVYIAMGDQYTILTAHQVARIWYHFPYPSNTPVKIKGQHFITHWMRLPKQPKQKKVTKE